MKPRSLGFWLVNGTTLWFLFNSCPAVAQIVPDATLPVNSSVRQQENISVIEGGTTAGSNLFHSFQEFSVPTSGTAFFNNAQNIQNILTRVTGGSISNIDGILRANGTANLFLLNPNGIIFGPNARLDIGGSFVGSTANSINFADGFQFSAANPQSTPLLTINVPIGLQFGQNPGRIEVQGTGYDLSAQLRSPIIRGNSITGLQVQPGKTLALVGGDIDLEGGTLTAEQGRIELGSIGNQAQVSLNSIPEGFALDYQGVQFFRDIRLSQQASADASGGGAIQVQGNNVRLTDGSIILIQNQGEQRGGQISVNAAQSLEASGPNPVAGFYGGLEGQTIGVGSSADIVVSTQQLVVRNGAAILTRSFSPGRAGNVTVNASDSIQVIGFSPIAPALSSVITAVGYHSGDGGDLTVSTKWLTIFNGGSVSTPSFGTGQGGDVTVNATEFIEISGVSRVGIPSSISTVNLGTGNSGKTTINTSRLVLQNGAIVSAASFASGRAGSVIVNARESIEVNGTMPESPTTPTYIGASAPELSESIQEIFRVPQVPTSSSGDVTINTGKLSVTEGARVQVSNVGVGDGGALRVNARSIFLDNQGGITAATASGESGNIELQVSDLLLLRRNSQISATAFSNGSGGNININTPLLVTVPRENSDISANSVSARGGNVIINSSGIFGTQFRNRNTLESDITATGASSELSGNVQINTPDIDPSSGLVELPVNIVDPTQLIAQGCPANRGNSFTITGRGGLPLLPSDALRSDQTATINWVTRERRENEEDKGTRGRRDTERVNVFASPRPNISASSLVEATGWVINKSGEVWLTASASTATSTTPQSSLSTPESCPPSETVGSD